MGRSVFFLVLCNCTFGGSLKRNSLAPAVGEIQPTSSIQIPVAALLPYLSSDLGSVLWLKGCYSLRAYLGDQSGHEGVMWSITFALSVFKLRLPRC